MKRKRKAENLNRRPSGESQIRQLPRQSNAKGKTTKPLEVRDVMRVFRTEDKLVRIRLQLPGLRTGVNIYADQDRLDDPKGTPRRLIKFLEGLISVVSVRAWREVTAYW